MFLNVRYVFVCGVFLLLFGLSASQTEAELVTESTEDVSLVICQTCNCTDGFIDCTNRNIEQPFELQDWEGVKNTQSITVDISQNPLSAMTKISSLPIQTLNMSNCKITTVEDASFMYLQDLVTLDLSHNEISTGKLSRRVFMGPFTNTEQNPVSFKNIRYLSLAYNDLHSLPPDVFTFMNELTTLDLSGNPLAFIDQVTMAALTDLVNLRELNMAGCELETLPEGLFRRQRRLRRLDLSDNRFTTVPAVISEAANLVYLNFGKNPIQVLETNNAIRNLTKLEDFRFCRNSKLQNITDGALAGLSNLVTLHICYNPRLTNIHSNFLAFTDDHDVEIWPLLSEFYLNNNNLSGIDSSFLSRWDQLSAVDVSNNPFTCDCKNQWVLDVLMPIVSGRNEEHAKNMICNRPAEMRGLSFLQISNASRTLTCDESESYADQPSSDMAVVLGIMIGICVTFPLVLVIVLLWKRGYFGRCRSRKNIHEGDDDETDAF